MGKLGNVQGKPIFLIPPGLHGVARKGSGLPVENYFPYSISEGAEATLPPLRLTLNLYTGYPRMVPMVEPPFFGTF